MRKTLFAIALLFAAITANAQITSSGGQVYLADDALLSFTTPNICINPSFSYRTRSWVIKCYVGCSGSPDFEYLAGGQEFTLIFTAAEIDAYAATAGTETEEIVSVCEQAVIEYLEAITLNSGITFSH